MGGVCVALRGWKAISRGADRQPPYRRSARARVGGRKRSSAAKGEDAKVTLGLDEDVVMGAGTGQVDCEAADAQFDSGADLEEPKSD